MGDAETNQSRDGERAARWTALVPVDRRVLGALVEKAKTTPDVYPMSLNALCSACNQKSNRNPIMNLGTDQVEDSLERLRQLGAASAALGGRVERYRHHMYDWLGVEKIELSVMAELLLRGDQTVGELRSRAARMDPIADLSELQPLLNSLISKGLVIELTPRGRGQVVTHGLYSPVEKDRLTERYSEAGIAAVQPMAPAPDISRSDHDSESEPFTAGAVETVQPEIESFRAELAEIRELVEVLQNEQRHNTNQIQTIRESLGL